MKTNRYNCIKFCQSVYLDYSVVQINMKLIMKHLSRLNLQVSIKTIECH